MSAPLLAAPMRYVVANADGKAAVTAEKMQVVSAAGHEVVTRGGFSAGRLRTTWSNTWDYDGCVKVELTLEPTGGEELEQLTLEIPFAGAQVYAVPGKEALAAVVSYAHQDEKAAVQVDLKALELAGKSSITDAESSGALRIGPRGPLHAAAQTPRHPPDSFSGGGLHY